MLAQAYSALLHAAVKCGESELAVDVYGQMGREGMPRDRAVHVTMIEMFVKLGASATRWRPSGSCTPAGSPRHPPLQPGPRRCHQARAAALRPHRVSQVCPCSPSPLIHEISYCLTCAGRPLRCQVLGA